MRKFLLLVDGTRSIAQLVADLRSTVADEGGTTITREGVEENLRLLARLALLVPGSGAEAPSTSGGQQVRTPAGHRAGK